MGFVTPRLARGSERTAIVCGAGESTYANVDAASGRVATALMAGNGDLHEARVALLARPGRDYVFGLLGIWRAGGVAVPLCTGHPCPELEYVLGDSGAAAILADAAMEGLAREVAPCAGGRVLTLSDGLSTAPSGTPSIDGCRRAMMLYTSGTTSRPKGVVTTHANIAAQVTDLVDAWAWRAEDRILHVLPLHHIHGIVNALLCALWSSACGRRTRR